MKNLRMKSARAALDLSQQQLAEIVGVSRQTINAIEKGEYNPTIRLCIAICKALDRTLDDLFYVVVGKIKEKKAEYCCCDCDSEFDDFEDADSEPVV